HGVVRVVLVAHDVDPAVDLRVAVEELHAVAGPGEDRLLDAGAVADDEGRRGAGGRLAPALHRRVGALRDDGDATVVVGVAHQGHGVGPDDVAGDVQNGLGVESDPVVVPVVDGAVAEDV